MGHIPNHITVTDVYDLSRQYTFATQPGVAKAGCGPISVGIIKEQMLGASLDEDQWDRILRGEDIHSEGTFIDYLVALLEEPPRLNVKLVKKNRLAAMVDASVKQPVLVSWKFDRQYGGVGGHFNVCLGPTIDIGDNLIHLVILDPAFGLNYVVVERNEPDHDIVYIPMLGRDGKDVSNVDLVPGAASRLELDDFDQEQSATVIPIFN